MRKQWIDFPNFPRYSYVRMEKWRKNDGKKKIYAVRKGNKTGLFYSWDECKKAVHGYSGAEYKGFLTKDEAEAF